MAARELVTQKSVHREPLSQPEMWADEMMCILPTGS